MLSVYPNAIGDIGSVWFNKLLLVERPVAIEIGGNMSSGMRIL